MSLSALPIALTVPPLNLLSVGFAGLLIARWRHRAGLAVLALVLGGLLLLAMPLVAGELIAALERYLPLTPPGDAPPQAIVILSADAVRSAGTPGLAPGPLTLERERAGAALSRRTGLPILVTGGLVGDGPDTLAPDALAPETLAAVMARSLAEDFNTPVRWTEPKADDTWENAANSAALLQAEHIHSIYLVTHAWHMRRALIAFAHTGITVTAAPVRLDPAPTGELSELIPRTSAWLASYYALHEWIGCADYTLFKK